MEPMKQTGGAFWPVQTNRAVLDCVQHLFGRNLVRDPFDVDEVLRVMRWVRMNPNAIRWIEQNPGPFRQGLRFGFYAEEEGGRYDVEPIRG